MYIVGLQLYALVSVLYIILHEDTYNPIKANNVHERVITLIFPRIRFFTNSPPKLPKQFRFHNISCESKAIIE